MRTPAIIAALALLVALALAGPAAASVLPPDFEDHTLVDGLFFPTGEAWAPDGRMYVIQKDGQVFTVPPGSSSAEPLTKDGSTWNLQGQVSYYGDRGLLGVAVDAQFASNHYIYLLFTHKAFGAGAGDGNPASSQLMRVQLSAAGDQVVGSDVILGTQSTTACTQPPANDYDCIPSDSDTHSIGSVRSAPDGTLFVGSGDGAEWTTVDQKALRTYNEQSLAGKILHIDRDGHGLDGHPFCAADANLDDVCTKLFAKGFRNPYRFKLRPGGGLTVGDVGWSEREEVDVIGSGGRNYGWPCYEGVQHTPGYKALDACQAEYAKEDDPAARDVLPTVDYPHRDPDDPNPPFPSGNTVLGGPTYQGSDYPATYLNKIFVGDFSAEEIRTLSGSTLAPFGTDMGPIVDVDTAPDGNLVYTSLGDYSATGGSIHEISYSAANHSPAAHATSDADGGTTVHFDGSTSSDVEDGHNLTYDWDFGDHTSSTSESPAHTYAGPGRYPVKLTVTDTQGKTGTDSLVVQVGTPPSNLQIQAPANYRDGEPVTLHASADSTESLTYSWQLLLRHLSHFHTFTHQTGQDITFTPPDDHDADAFVDITLTVTDADGLESTQNMHLHPQTVPFNLDSEPAGAPMDYAGRSVTGPFHTQSAIGFAAGVSTAQSFTAGGHDYLFDGWDDFGGTDPTSSRVQNFTIPDSGLTLTARYRDVTPTIVTPAPPPPLPPPDHSGPRVRFKKLDPIRGLVSGTTTDAAGVRQVYVALGRATRAKRCLWWATSVGRLSHAARACAKPRWIRATLKGSTWTAKLHGRHVPPGSYRLLVRARDRLGNVTNTFKRVSVKAAKPCSARGASSRSPSVGSRKCPRR